GGEPGHRVPDSGITRGPDPAHVGVAGERVRRVAPLPEPDGDVAAEHLAPAGLQPLPAQPQPGDQPDPGGPAGAEEPPRGPRLLEIDRPSRRIMRLWGHLPPPWGTTTHRPYPSKTGRKPRAAPPRPGPARPGNQP